MNASPTALRLTWAGGVHVFDLAPPPPPEPETGMTTGALSRAAGDYMATLRRGLTGPAEPFALHDRENAILRRLVGGGWGRDDVQNIIGVALQNGGSIPRQYGRLDAVAELVDTFVTGRPLGESLPLAQCILFATLYGVPPDVAEADMLPSIALARLTEHATAQESAA